VTWQADYPPLLLASASAGRRALLKAAGLQFDVCPARIDEAALKAAARAERLSASDTALLLAQAKGARIAARDPDALVIGCDQLLVCGDDWFDKPANLAAARAQLRALRGRTHTLVTAVLCQRGDRRLWHCVATPRLTMRDFSDATLEAYLALEGAHVTVTVGAYRIEGPGIQLFDTIDGDNAAIVGLPLLPLLGFLRQHGVLAS
jgi:septum formation protein